MGQLGGIPRVGVELLPSCRGRRAFATPGSTRWRNGWGCRMRRMIRLDRAAGLACTIAGLVLVAGFLSPGPAIAAGPAGITDPGGDTINRDTNAKLTAAAADIVSASVDSGAGGIVLSFRTAQMPNPATDPGWGSGNTSAS